MVLKDRALAHDPITAYAPNTQASRSPRQQRALSLLNPLPRSMSEAARRIKPMRLSTARRALTSMIEREELSHWEGDRLSPLFKVIGVAGVSERLSALTAPGRSEEQRSQALAALFHSPQGQPLFESLSERERVELSAPWVRPMAALAHDDGFPRYALAALFEATSPQLHATLLLLFERCRREVSGCALRVYEVILRKGTLSAPSLRLLFEELSFSAELEELEPLVAELSPRVQSAYREALSAQHKIEAG